MRRGGTSHAPRAAIASLPRPVCVIASGETTVTVTGAGQGRPQSGVRVRDGAVAGRHSAPHVAAASIGTDGIDGPTDAAGRHRRYHNI